MQKFSFRYFTVLLFVLLSFHATGSCYSEGVTKNDGNTPVPIKRSIAQGFPKDSYIQASINGHYLTVAFTNNIGHVTVEVSEVNGGESQVESTPTPNGVIFYIVDTGSYIVTFTFSDGDIYYGEFEVTD